MIKYVAIKYTKMLFILDDIILFFRYIIARLQLFVFSKLNNNSNIKIVDSYSRLCKFSDSISDGIRHYGATYHISPKDGDPLLPIYNIINKEQILIVVYPKSSIRKGGNTQVLCYFTFINIEEEISFLLQSKLIPQPENNLVKIENCYVIDKLRIFLYNDTSTINNINTALFNVRMRKA